MAEGRVDATHAVIFSADEGADVGVDEGTPVTEAYTAANSRLTGKIHQVTVEVR